MGFKILNALCLQRIAYQPQFAAVQKCQETKLYIGALDMGQVQQFITWGAIWLLRSQESAL